MIFADSFYWTALANQRDQWHERVMELSRSLTSARLITTDEVLSEVLNYYSALSGYMRQRVTRLIRDILSNESIEVVPQSRESFMSGLVLYESRADKGYSLTDCTSMEIMRQQAINEILTHDHHFTQEGFKILF